MAAVIALAGCTGGGLPRLRCDHAVPINAPLAPIASSAAGTASAPLPWQDARVGDADTAAASSEIAGASVLETVIVERSALP